MKLLRLANTINSTSAPYNQFSLGLKNHIDQTFCSLYRPLVDVDKKINFFHGNGSILKVYKSIKATIKSTEYDVVHIHSGLMGIIFLLSIFPNQLCLLNKSVFTLHNSWNVLKARNKFLNFIVMLTVKKICTCGISSNKSIPYLINLFIQKKCQTIINGFNHERMDEVARSHKKILYFDNNPKIKFVCIGAFNKTKNQISLLNVLRENSFNFELIFLGEGPKRKELMNYSKNISNVSKIAFKGRVSRDTAIKHMLEADVSISVSKGEGLPIAVLESMYAGCFLILSDIPPHKEISPPSERCIFINPDNKNEIIKSIKYVLDNHRLIRSLRSKSKQHAIQKFSAEEMLKNYLRIYKSLENK